MASKNTVRHRGESLSADEDYVAEHHGQSLASWTAVAILLVAAALISLSFPLESWRMPLLVTGLVLVVVGLVAGKVLAAAGHGIERGPITDIADAPEVSNRDDVGIS